MFKSKEAELFTEERQNRRVMNHKYPGQLHPMKLCVCVFIYSLTRCPDRWPFYLTSRHERCPLLLYEFWVTLPRRQDPPKCSSPLSHRSGRAEITALWLKCILVLKALFAYQRYKRSSWIHAKSIPSGISRMMRSDVKWSRMSSGSGAAPEPDVNSSRRIEPPATLGAHGSHYVTGSSDLPVPQYLYICSQLRSRRSCSFPWSSTPSWSFVGSLCLFKVMLSNEGKQTSQRDRRASQKLLRLTIYYFEHQHFDCN